MNAQTNYIDCDAYYPTLVKLVKDVAKAAGGKVLRLPNKERNSSGQIEVDGIPVDILFYQSEQRLKVDVGNPQFINEDGAKQTVRLKDNYNSEDGDTRVMGFALDRPAQAIANGIKHRLVPDMRACYERCVKIGKGYEKYNSDRAALLDQMARHFNVKPWKHSLSLNGCTINVSNNDIKFESFSVSPETAKKIAALIKADKHSRD